MTIQEFKYAIELREQIATYQKLAEITLKPYIKFSRKPVHILSHDETKVCIADPELAALVRDYANNCIKKLEEKFQNIGGKI